MDGARPFQHLAYGRACVRCGNRLNVLESISNYSRPGGPIQISRDASEPSTRCPSYDTTFQSRKDRIVPETRPEQAAILDHGGRFYIGAFCTFTGTLTPTISERLDHSDLPPDSKNSPRTVSTSKTTLQIPQLSFARDTKLGIRLLATIQEGLRTCSEGSFSGASGRDANRLIRIPNRRA